MSDASRVLIGALLLSVATAGCARTAPDAWPLDEASLARTIVRSPSYQAIVKRGARPYFFIEEGLSTPERCAVFLGEDGDDFVHRVETLGFRPDGSIEKLQTRPDFEWEWVFEAGPGW
jgi:hypothetical protein